MALKLWAISVCLFLDFKECVFCKLFKVLILVK